MRRLTLALLLLLMGTPAVAQAAPPAACPTIMPIAEVAAQSAAAAGLHATGWTVARGDTIEPFDVTVLGVLDDGVAPGVDMIIVDTDSPALDRAQGIWAGMSGSPVYADDGRLIGAVAFGLSFGPSKVGGLAAAADMVEVLDRQPAAAQTARVTAALQKKMVATGEVTAGQAASGLQRLRMPLSVSGLAGGRLKTFADRLPGHENFIPYAAGAAAPAAGNPAAIVPGGNFAASLSYGDLTAAGVGTTTIVCGGKVVAFGHPMLFEGPTALSMHNATAITIQDDPTLVPFKLANIGGTVGTLDQDRLSGVRGVFGAAPRSIPVTSTAVDGRVRRDGLTNVNRTRDVPLLAPFHLVANLDRVMDRIGGGRTTIGWTVVGTAGGRQFSLTRNNRFADRFDVSFASVFELADMLATLAENRFVDVSFKSLDIDATVQAPFRSYRIKFVQRRVGSAWRPVRQNRRLRVAAGATIRLRVLLAADRSTAAIPPVAVGLKVPAKAAGKEGSLEVTGGGEGGIQEGPFLLEGPPGEEGLEASDEPQSFGDLLEDLEDTPRNDEVRAQLRLFGQESSRARVMRVRRMVPEVVVGGMSARVRVAPARPRLDVRGKSALRLAPALRRGIALTVRTSAAGRIVLRGLVDRKTARRLKLVKKAKRPVLVAAASKRVRAGRSTVKLRFTRKARRRLRDAKRVRVAVRATIRTAQGGTATERSSVTLKG